MSPPPSRLKAGAPPRGAGAKGAVGARMRGLLLFAHGARDPAWAGPFEAVAERARAAAPGTPVVLAFLEFMTPDLLTAGTSLADAGCEAVDVVPLFLGSGGHVRQDVPALLQRLRDARPALQVRLHAPVGESAAVIDAMARAALDAASR
jgi:sirohydrochlorin cobaltochelatase